MRAVDPPVAGDVATTRAHGEMLSHTASAIHVGALVGRYCPVDSLIRAAVPDYTVTWERKQS
jgi:hypothetical protein